jgi:hypothetical protein
MSGVQYITGCCHFGNSRHHLTVCLIVKVATAENSAFHPASCRERIVTNYGEQRIDPENSVCCLSNGLRRSEAYFPCPETAGKYVGKNLIFLYYLIKNAVLLCGVRK